MIYAIEFYFCEIDYAVSEMIIISNYIYTVIINNKKDIKYLKISLTINIEIKWKKETKLK
jgi:hypothetical protein